MNSIILHSPMEALWELDIKSDFSASQIQTCNDGGQEQTAPLLCFLLEFSIPTFKPI